MRRALAGSLNTGLMPSSSLCAKRGGSTTFTTDVFPVIRSGCGPQAPYSVTVRRKAATRAYTPVTRAPQAHPLCPAHFLPECSTCKTLRIPAALCYSKGHHNPGHIDRLTLLKTCALHGLPPCPRCTLMQRGVGIVVPAGTTKCARKHQHVPSKQHHPKAHASANACAPQAPHITIWCTHHTSHSHRQSPSDGDPSPPPPPPSPTAALPQGMSKDDGMDMARPLFGQGHGRATQEKTQTRPTHRGCDYVEE